MSEKLNGAGIYKLTCIINGKIYIGKTVNFNRRLNRHKNSSNDKGDSHLKRAIIKYGWESFYCEILERFDNFDKALDNTKLLDKESYYIQLFDSTNVDKGYNLCKYSTDRTGIPCSEEHKSKIGKSNLGKKHTEEAKKKISQTHLGKPKSDKHKEKIRIGRLGKKHSEETKKKLQQLRLNNPRSKECNEGVRQKLLGRTYSEETIEKMKLASKGRNMGRKHTDEAKEKMKLAKIKNKCNSST
jgi:group I intron endonuclease